MSNVPITTPQASFITSLLSQRLKTLGLATMDEAKAAIGLDALTKFDASVLIGRLKAMPTDPVGDMPVVVNNSTRKGINTRASRCESCGHVVEANAGYYYAVTTGGWAVHHKVGECNTMPAPQAVVPVKDTFYQCAGQAFVHVYVTGTGRLAARLMSNVGVFNYERGGLELVKAGGVIVSAHEVANEQCMRRFGCPLGSEELRQKAAKHGRDHGNCIFCNLDLTDPNSDPAKGGVGYGPICAKKYGLPWGGK